MSSVKTILILIGDTTRSLQYCDRLGIYLSQLYQGDKVRVVMAVWSLSYWIGPPAASAAMIPGPSYLDELPKSHLVSITDLADAVTKSLQSLTTNISARELDIPIVENVIELIWMLNVDLLVVDRPGQPNLIDHLAMVPRSLELHLGQIIRKSPVPVLVIPDKDNSQ